MIVLLKRMIPISVKKILKDSLSGLINPKPSDPWKYLKQKSNGSIFISPGHEAQVACEKIKKLYEPLLEKYYINPDDFFSGSIKNEDAMALYEMVRKKQPNLFYHVGTFVGYSTMIVAEAMKANKKGRIITVDPEIPHRTKTNPVNIAREFAQRHHYDNISFVRGFNATVLGDDYFPESFKKEIPIVGYEYLHELKKPIDMAFIDGDHSTMATICDFLLIKDFLPLGGTIIFHDVKTWKTVAKAMEIIYNDEYYLRQGTSRYFSFDTWEGPDGLAAFEKIAENNNPLCKITMCDSKTHQPVKDALINIPSHNYKTLTLGDGIAYIFNEVYPDTLIHITCDEYFPYSSGLGTATNSGYVEVTLPMEKTKSTSS